MTPLLDQLLAIFVLQPTAPLQPGAARLLFLTSIICHALPELFPSTKALIQLLGPPGSAKSTLARCVGRIFAGPDFDICGVPRSEDDFFILAARLNPLVIDNVEHAPKWFPDALARAVSGAAFQKRKLYKDDELVRLKATAWIWSTSFSSALARGDLLQRSIIIRLAPPQQYRPEARVLGVVGAHVGDLLAEVNVVAQHVRERVASSCWLGPPPSAGRLADFGQVSRNIAFVLGGEEAVALLDQAFSGMRIERLRLMAEADPFHAFLVGWASDPENRGEDGGVGRWIPPAFLVDQYSSHLGNDRTFTGTKYSVVQMGSLLTDMAKSTAGIVRVERRTLNGCRLYRLTMADQPAPTAEPTTPLKLVLP
ncbi:MAG: P-loop NTPase family protein [Myxococcaceae bacterium]